MDSSAAGLGVKNIDCLRSENGAAHNTSKYESDAVILRRGELFKLVIAADGPVDLEAQKFEIALTSGHSPSRRNGSLVNVERVDKLTKGSWGYEVAAGKGNLLTVTVSIPSNALVAQYKLSIISISYRGRKRQLTSYDHNQDVFILFNPWCRDDEVFMEDAEKRAEYVLNDEGHIYWGGRKPKWWYYGQFEDASLRCAFYLLERIETVKRDTAREVSRAISALANHFDNDGVLVGNWSDDYSGGRKPWEWSGSAAILARFYEGGGEPVKYGQCWVFSGVVTALMRSLGIATRSVTNYDSAHDADGNLTFDKYYDWDGSYLDDESDDSCWNFHVWNDCWFARPDLPAGHGGWQAMDATPQELSSGVYRAGPASLKAIKEGNVDLRYDTKFIFAEVNADTVYWKKNKTTGEFEPIRVDPDNVGRFISTKAVGANNYDRHDITEEYKYAEKSVAERIVTKRALKIAKNPVVKEHAKDVIFQSSAEDIAIGSDITVNLSMENTSAKARKIDVIITAHVVRYNGVALEKLPPLKGNGVVSPKGKEDLQFKVERKQYWRHLDENPLIRFSLLAMVSDTDQIYVDQKVVDIDLPAISVTVLGNATSRAAGGDITVRAEIPQPHGIPTMTNCTIVFDGSAVSKPQSFELSDISNEGKTFTVEKTISARKHVHDRTFTQLLVTFNCKQISGLQGNAMIAIH